VKYVTAASVVMNIIAEHIKTVASRTWRLAVVLGSSTVGRTNYRVMQQYFMVLK